MCKERRKQCESCATADDSLIRIMTQIFLITSPAIVRFLLLTTLTMGQKLSQVPNAIRKYRNKTTAGSDSEKTTNEPKRSRTERRKQMLKRFEKRRLVSESSSSASSGVFSGQAKLTEISSNSHDEVVISGDDLLILTSGKKNVYDSLDDSTSSLASATSTDSVSEEPSDAKK